jgi:hypothetical protein
MLLTKILTKKGFCIKTPIPVSDKKGVLSFDKLKQKVFFNF